MRRYPTYKRVTAGITLALWALWFGYLLLWPKPGATGEIGIAIGQAAPDFTLHTVDGQQYRLADLRGRPVMVNFFATWCPPCKAEMPLLEEAHRREQGSGSDLVILAIDLNEAAVTVRSFQERLGLTLPILIDKGDQVSRRYGIVPLPTSYFIDREGIVRAKATSELRPSHLNDLLQLIR